jgi:diaminohydroxyphosphoribosylaminopyrimidine deaminase/5-amino-6-(5-phosphoribosylamino)uracil reductase
MEKALMKAHAYFLKKALTLAKQRRGFCAPNPSVGAVIVHNNNIISSGNHFAYGFDHAELTALKKIKSMPTSISGEAILYCTLEPCCHYGKTPPCTDAIIQSGIKKVVYGFPDPNPLIRGKTEKILQDAGISCIHSPLPEINKFYQSYSYWTATGLPFVTAKLAISLDGKIALENYQRAYISGKEAQLFTHQQRLKSDAILTTAKTVLADNPQLNIRLNQKIIKKIIYIIDRKNILSKFNHLAIFDTTEKIIFFNHPDMSLEDMLQSIGKAGVHGLWVEAGGQLFSSLAVSQLLQKAYIYISPKTLGSSAIPAFNSQTDIFKHVKLTQWHSKGMDAVGEFDWV